MVSRNNSRAFRNGFTLVELLVVISITCLIIGFAIPALQGARESAQRLACTNNLKQIGIALYQHHDSHNVLPSNGGWDGTQTIASLAGPAFTPSTTDLDIVGSPTFKWGVGVPSRTPIDQTGSWAYSILPYLEQQSAYQSQAWSTAVRTLICPSRRLATSEKVTLSDEHGLYEGGEWKWGRTDYAGNNLIIGPRKKCVHISEIRDGTSNTILIGEKASDPSIRATGGWYYDEPYFLGGSAGTTRGGFQVLKDMNGVDFKSNWGSAHANVALFLFADGSVHPIKYGISWMNMLHQLTPKGGEPTISP